MWHPISGAKEDFFTDLRKILKIVEPIWEVNPFPKSEKNNMPYISIESGKLTAEQKKQLIERLTATPSEITDIPEQFFSVTIKEIPDENFGIGGKSIDVIKRNYKP